MSFRYGSGINKPGFNPLAAQTSTYAYNLFGWGNNYGGALGTGNSTLYSSPKQVGSLTGWATISFGNNNCVSIKTDGTLWTWGTNPFGQLGLGNTTYYSSPKQVGALTNWSKAFTNGNNACIAIKTDGTLWTWGSNQFGQLGLGNTTYYSSPKQVGLLTNWSSLGGGYGSLVAVKTDGTLWTWGRNESGQLGQGNFTYLSSPKQVGSLTNWLVAACAPSSCLQK